MGVFYVDCEVVNVRRPDRAVVVPKLLVDSGAEFTWIPESALKQAGVQIVKKDLPFLMANGQTITRSTGYVILRAGEFETVDEVVFGQPGDLSLLGARTLEGFGATVDARKKRLVAAGPYLAASAIPLPSHSEGRCKISTTYRLKEGAPSKPPPPEPGRITTHAGGTKA